MQSSMLCIVLVLSAIGGSVAEPETTPLKKVVDMLTAMAKTSKDAKEAEELQYAHFHRFCQNKIAENSDQITEEEAWIEQLKAKIGGEDAQIKKDDNQILKDEELLVMYEHALDKQIGERKLEHSDFEATQLSYRESIEKLKAALSALPGKEKEAMLQVAAVKNAKMVPEKAKKAIESFIQTQVDPADEGFAGGTPEAAAYESHSGAIMEMLSSLLKDMERAASSEQQEELVAAHHYEEVKAELALQIELLKRDRGSRQEDESKVIRVKKVDVSELTDTTFMHTQDYDDVNALIANCDEKAKVFAERQQLRADEIEAIGQAVGVLTDGRIEENAGKYLNWMQQSQQATSLGQLRARSISPTQAKVVRYLQSEGKRLASHELSALALRCADDPYGKVKKMITDLVSRLADEAAQEEEQKGWCDRELSSNKDTRTRKQEYLDDLMGEVEEVQAELGTLKESYNEITKELNEVSKEMQEATSIREEEKSKAQKQVDDAKSAQNAVQQALQVLKDFYQKAGESTAFIQHRASGDIIYKGMQQESQGVMKVLATIQSDFARVEAETLADESASENEFNELKLRLREQTLTKTSREQHFASVIKDRKNTITTLNKYVKGTQEELDAATSYYNDLKTKCSSGASFEDRQEARQEEIKSLQKALDVFNGVDIDLA